MRILSFEHKAGIKWEMLLNYAPWVAGILASGKRQPDDAAKIPVPPDVLTRTMDLTPEEYIPDQVRAPELSDRAGAAPGFHLFTVT